MKGRERKRREKNEGKGMEKKRMKRIERKGMEGMKRMKAHDTYLGGRVNVDDKIWPKKGNRGKIGVVPAVN